MEVYNALATALDADWIEPEYEFPALNEDRLMLQRSVDFVASVNADGGPFSKVQLYFLVECKFAGQATFLFMEDRAPSHGGAWDPWRPALWQDKEPVEPAATVPASLPPQLPKCARGTVLGLGHSSSDTNKPEKMPGLDTALHQLREGLHSLAIERFRLFTKTWSQPEAIVFVPVVVTNAPLRVFQPGTYQKLIAEQFDLTRDTLLSERLLVRCPGRIDHVHWKSERFEEQYHGSDLSRIAAGLPFYKRKEQRNLRFHMSQFFEQAPAYVTVLNLPRLKPLLDETIAWAKGLQFESVSVLPSKRPESARAPGRAKVRRGRRRRIGGGSRAGKGPPG